jgi:hypothetical protein
LRWFWQPSFKNLAHNRSSDLNGGAICIEPIAFDPA